MKISIDFEKCCGYGECVAVSPVLFQIEDDGRAHLTKDGGFSDNEVALIREAGYSCPVEAIEVTE